MRVSGSADSIVGHETCIVDSSKEKKMNVVDCSDPSPCRVENHE